MSHTQRYFENTLPVIETDAETLRQALAKLREAVANGVQLVEQHMHHSSKTKMYTGDSGIALMYMRLSMQASALNLPPALAKVLNSRIHSHLPAYSAPHAVEAGYISPLDTSTGPAILVLLQGLKHPGSFNDRTWSAALTTFKDAVAIARTDDRVGGDEVLYGRAGLLWAMLNVFKAAEGALDCDQKEDLLAIVGGSAISEVAERTLDAGIAGARMYRKEHGEGGPPLAWLWHGKYYLGAIHGIAGILTILLQCPRGIIDSYIKLISDTITYLVNLASNDGHLPSSLPVKPRPDSLVQVCHGSPGLLLLLIAFRSHYEQHYHPDWQTTESKASRSVWETGLLRKGLGVCHGVTGNAWPWLLLAYSTRSTKSNLSRALTFLVHAMELPPMVHSPIMPYDTPDHPYSLFEGLAGAVCGWAEACVVVKALLDQDDFASTPVLGLPGLGGLGPFGML